MADLSYTKKRERGASIIVGTPIDAAPTPNIIDGLLASYVKTQVVAQSFQVLKGVEVIASFSNNNISGWKKAGAVIEIIGVSPIKLSFINQTEATLAEARIASCINGNVVS